MQHRPKLSSYMDYRVYLRDWLAHQRAVEPGYSFERFATASGLSRSALPNVLNGSRAPKASTLDGFARALGLTPTERNLLGVLVELDRAPSVSDRMRVMSRMLQHPAYRKTEWIESRPSDFERLASHWYYTAIQEMASLPGFRLEAEWISATIVPTISVAEAQAAIDTLLELKLLEVAADGAVSVANIRISTRPETAARASVRFHREAVPYLVSQIEDVPAELRHLVAAVLTIPTSQLPEVKRMLTNVVERIATQGDQRTDAGQRVFQLAIQLVPVSQELGGTTLASPSSEPDPDE